MTLHAPRAARVTPPRRAMLAPWHAKALGSALLRTLACSVARSASTILDGPESWPVRPVVELSLEREDDEPATREVLAGDIWQTLPGLTMDVAINILRGGVEHGPELRTGFTWHMQVPGRS